MWRKDDEGSFSPKLRVRIKDNNSPHGKFHRFLFPFSSKFSDLKFSIFTYIMSRVTHSEPGLPMGKLLVETSKSVKLWLCWGIIRTQWVLRNLLHPCGRMARNKLSSLNIKIAISSLVIGLKKSYFPLIHLPSCYLRVCYWTVCYRTVQ